MFTRIQGGYVLLITARIHKHRRDESQPGPDKRPSKINRRCGHARRMRPTEILGGLKQRFALVAMWKRPGPRAGNKYSAVFRRQKRRAQRHMLCPMAEVIGLSFVYHFLSEMGHGLCATDFDLAVKSQAGHWKSNRQLQDGFVLAHPRSNLLPPQARRLAVDRQSLSRFFCRRSPKVVETEVMSNNSRDHSADNGRAVRC